MAFARFRSRSPRGEGQGTPDFLNLIVQRETARLGKDFATADSLRQHLKSIGVEVYDKTNTWKSSDGRSGRVPSFTEIEQGVSPDALLSAVAPAAMPQPELGTSDPDYHIKQLVLQREQARAAKDWGKSDQIRDELKAYGVEIWDKEKLWKSSDGRSGVVLGYLSHGPSDIEINTLVLQREKKRAGNDFNTADMIRQELKKHGVEVYDKEKILKAADGRSGQVPNADGTAAGGVMGMMPQMQVLGGMPQMPQMMAMPQMGTPQGAQGLAAENAMLKALLLQAVQGGIGAIQQPGMQMAMPQMQMAPQMMAAPRMARPAQPAAQASPEASEALNYIQQAAMSGTSPGDAEINWLVQCREKFRAAKDMGSADAIRTAMKTSLSIELWDKTKIWKAADGRQGVISL